jgi:hypothetical protein
LIAYLFNFSIIFLYQANFNSSPLAPPTKSKKKKSNAKKGDAPSTPKKANMQGQGGGRPKGCKFEHSPGGTRTYVAPPGSISSQGKRKLAGADIVPSSSTSANSDETCAHMISEMSDLKRKYRRLVLKNEAYEKVSVTFITQLKNLVSARDGEEESMRKMLEDTQSLIWTLVVLSGLRSHMLSNISKVKKATFFDLMARYRRGREYLK